VREFVAFAGVGNYMELRSVARSHIIGWRKDMESRNLSAATILRKLSALSSLFDYLCESRRRQSSRRRKAARRPTATKAAHRPWAAGRHANFWRRRRTRSRAHAIELFSRPCSAGAAPTEGAIHDPLPVTSAVFHAHQQGVSRVSPEKRRI
jgi:Phage integrase, N-terminal SAM-like domain